METQIDIDTPEAIITAIPHLIGFQPQPPNLVIIGSKDGKVTCAGSADIDTDSGIVVPKIPLGFIDGTLTDAVLLIGFGPHEVLGPIMAAVVVLVNSRGIEVAEALITRDGRYWDLVADDTPDDGTALPNEPSPLQASLTYRGLQSFPSRDAIDALFAPVTGETQQATWEAISDLHRTLLNGKGSNILDAFATSTIEQLHEAITNDGLPDVDLTARLAIGLTMPAVRDAAMTAVDQQPPRASEALWIHLVKHTSGELRTAPAVLAAYSAWRGGAGHIATAALDAVDADYRDDPVAQQLAELMASAVHPTAVDAYAPGQPLTRT